MCEHNRPGQAAPNHKQNKTKQKKARKRKKTKQKKARKKARKNTIKGEKWVADTFSRERHKRGKAKVVVCYERQGGRYSGEEKRPGAILNACLIVPQPQEHQP